MAEIRTELLAYLYENDFSPGDKLPGEVALAKKLEVTRTVLRKALLQLEGLGLLDRTKKRGTFIKALDPAQLNAALAASFRLAGFGFEELKEARLIIETALLPLTVQRLNPVTIQKMEACISDMEKEAGNPPEADLLDRDFHLMLLEACQNPVLQIFSSIIFLIFRSQNRSRYLTEQWARKSAKDHREILKAMKKGDSVLACELMREHILPTLSKD